MLDTSQQGPMDGTLVIKTRRGLIKGDIEGYSYIVGGEYKEGVGGYLLQAFSSTKFTIKGYTGNYWNITGRGSLSNLDSPVTIYLDGGGHVTDVDGSLNFKVPCYARLR